MTASSRAKVADFDPARLTLARLAAGMRKVELAQAIGVTAAAVSQYENAHARPSAGVLAQIAWSLRVPVAFFAPHRPMSPLRVSTAHFRRLRAASQLDRQQAVARAALGWEVIHQIEQKVELPPISLPDELALVPEASTNDASLAATQLRTLWDLGTEPVPNVVRLLESRGVVVIRLGSLSERLDAFSQWVAERPFVVLSTDKGDAARSRFDAAHELGHLVMHPDAEPGSQRLETQAQQFASVFLMPEERIGEELPDRVHWPRLVELKGRWGVSIQALLFRGRTLGIYSESAYTRAMTTLSRKGWRTSEPGPIQPPERAVLVQRSLKLLAETGYGIEDLASATQIPIALIEEIFELNSRPLVQLPQDDGIAASG